MKQFALILLITAPFFASAQPKFPQKIKSTVESLIAYRPTLNAVVAIEYRVKKKVITVKKRPAREARKCVHTSRLRKKSKIWLYANVGFTMGKLVKQ